jgi:5'-3' exonuclease
MNRLGVVDYAASDDGDLFPFGAKKIIRGVGWRSKRSLKMKLYNVPKILKQIGITYDQLVEMCILCENDFNKDGRIKVADSIFKI